MSDIDWAAITAALQAPTDPASIDFRPQGELYERNGKHSGRVLAYIDARAVMDRLDAAVGPGNWAGCPEPLILDTAVRVVRYGLTIHGVTKYAIGDAGATEPSKSADSDGLKRAAVLWGIGRDLYSIEAEYVEGIPSKNARGGDSWRIADGEVERLRKKLANVRAAQQTQRAVVAAERRAPSEAATDAPDAGYEAAVHAFKHAATLAGYATPDAQTAYIREQFPERRIKSLTEAEWHALADKCRSMYSDVPAEAPLFD